MAFWRVAGFAQPSPIEQILDKEEYTLEELLDEDDIIQECKSLNGRLIAFLREKEVVEQLLRYLVQPPSDPDDPKKQYKYPFTACEVFCCEVEAIFNTLLEDEALLDLLCSLLDADPPLSCKTAGYFGRVVGQLLLRKTNEMMQYLSNHDGLLEKLVRHLDVTSIADVIKRLAGADEQSSMVFLPMHTQWLVDTQLLDMLLERLGPAWSSDTVTNAADILTAVAHTQPSALSAKLMQPLSIAALFNRALEPGGKVLVPALEVCSALLEPRRGMQGADALGSGGGSPGGSGVGAEGTGGSNGSPMAASVAAADASSSKSRSEALGAMLVYLPQLVSFLASQDADAVQETPYGLLAPPLGRARLKVVELLAVLLHVGDEEVDSALIAANVMGLVMDLFAQYPFNNLMHHQVLYMLQGLLQRASPAMVSHTFGTCGLVSWLSGLPQEVTPRPRPGPPPKGPLRAGYLGHVTRMANLLLDAAAQKPTVADALAGDAAWQQFVSGELQRRNEMEDVSRWECGRPASTDMDNLGSEGDDFQTDMDLEQMQGMQPTVYHRYGVLDEIDDDDEDGSGMAGAGGGAGGGGDYSGASYGMMLAAAMQNMDISDGGGASSSGDGEGGREMEDAMDLAETDRRPTAEGRVAAGAEAGTGQGIGSSWSLLAHPGSPSAQAAADASAERAMEDDAVLLATSDDEDGPSASGGGSPGPGEQATASSGGGDDAVVVESPSPLNQSARAEAAASAAAATDAGGGPEGGLAVDGRSSGTLGVGGPVSDSDQQPPSSAGGKDNGFDDNALWCQSAPSPEAAS